ncbi:MAG: DUF6178 family protein, partial [Thermodesulfobacteriota bacterium]|nr:DUF6178 family protein [Thermodesulfobacteriota bacterium]
MVKKSKAVERGQKAPIFSPSDLLKMSIKRAERLFNSLTVHEQIDMILKARGKYREAIILLSKKPEELVRLIPEEEIFFTIKEIGENDAITLISLLNPQQLLYVMDLEMWKKGQFITQKFIQWLQILLECG